MHPTIATEELNFICQSLKDLTENIEEWSKDYQYEAIKNDFVHKTVAPIEKQLVKEWFKI